MQPLLLALSMTVASPDPELMVERLQKGLDPAAIAASLHRYALPTWFDPQGNLVIRVERNTPKSLPPIAFIARLERGPVLVHPGYAGEDLRLPAGRLSYKSHPDLEDYLGNDLVTSDGKAPLLGVGAVESLTALETLLAHPEWKHGELVFVFQKGPFDPGTIGVRWAYTMEAGKRGEFGNQSFNAATVLVNLFSEKKSLNAIPVAAEFVRNLPDAPEKNGFIHPASLKADPKKASMTFLLRDFEKRGLAQKEGTLRQAAVKTQKAYPPVKLTLETIPAYQNLRLSLDREPRVTRLATEAYRQAGLKPAFIAFREDADCISYSSKGVPTGALFSGVVEEQWLPVNAMVQASEVILQLSRLTAQ